MTIELKWIYIKYGMNVRLDKMLTATTQES